MKIQKFNEDKEEKYSKKYIFIVPNYARTYRGSMFDSPSKPWIPDNAKMVAEFECPDGYNYMTVTQAELDEINQIKAGHQREKDAKKYNL